MKSLLKRLIGADRPKIIAVLAATRADAAACVAHAGTGNSGLPVWVWCAEPGEPLPDCARYASASAASRDLRTVWPALTIVSWPGTRTATGLKLLPFTVPPFRIVVRNEAGGFFPASPGPLLNHAARRARDAAKSVSTRLGEWLAFTPQLLRAILWHIRDRSTGSGAQSSPFSRCWPRLSGPWHSPR